MASSDQDIIDRARTLTDVPSQVMSDSDIQNIVDIGKDELRSWFDDSSYSFYTGDLDADQALFWFTVIGVKIRLGEITSVNLRIADIHTETFSGTQYDWLFNNFNKHLTDAEKNISELAGMSKKNLSRDGRAYGDNA